MKIGAESIQTVATCLKEGTQILESAGVPEAEISASELLSNVLKRPRLSLYLEPETTVDYLRESEFENLLAKRASRYPLQYLISIVPFRHALLEIGEGCLIPRPETEILIDVVMKRLSTIESIWVLDVGTGSGNIAISLAQEYPKWRIVATDISEGALPYARINAVRNQVASQIRFVQTNLFGGLGEFFDVLISNPPYLTASELEHLQPEVAFEPRIALDGREDGLYFFKDIIRNSRKVLKPGGFIFFEMGINQANAVSSMLEANDFESIQIEKDDSGIERFISARMNSETTART
ncbi:MAG: peptide chain release factor N(5)-glutamine methyltransferase [Candidatus Omnitrophica bacterium]|nr:peptide chain release factor N(5)-glutamine methyltransferase [Candidatus Omnitrophota bacterium]